MPTGFKVGAWFIGTLVVLFVFIQIWLALDEMLGYFWFDVRADEVGIKLIGNQPVEVLPPGKYTDYGLGNIGQFKDIQTVKVNELPFSVSDAEVLTQDKQRIGALVTGTVRRPGQDNPQVLLQYWSQYKSFYLNDPLLVGREEGSGKEVRVVPGLMQSLGQQAMKVCIGDLTFDKAVIGSARDTLKDCIAREMGELANGYGLTVRNVVVPNIILSQAVQQNLDAITDARLKTELADQRKLQAEQEAKQEQARQQGAIQVEQGRIQEKAKQDKLTAELEKNAQDAQYALIESKKKNELLTSNRDKEIAEINRQTAEINAKAATAPRLAEAQVYQANPAYADYQETVARASAFKQTDKVMLIPNNSDPLLFLGDSSRTPVTIQPQGR